MSIVNPSRCCCPRNAVKPRDPFQLRAKLVLDLKTHWDSPQASKSSPLEYPFGEFKPTLYTPPLQSQPHFPDYKLTLTLGEGERERKKKREEIATTPWFDTIINCLQLFLFHRNAPKKTSGNVDIKKRN